MSSLPPPGVPPDLATLRRELDGLDDEMHDLVMRRAGIVGTIGKLASKGAVKHRPGREAAILHRLLARHAGPFPPAALVMLWRQMINGMTALQAPYALAVCDTDPAGGYVAVAREQFGALATLRVYRTPSQAIGEVSAGSATAAILPLPTEWDTASAAWWTALLHKDEPRIHVTARLPFWAARPEGAPKVQALVVSAVPPDPSGADRTLLGLEVSPEQSRARLAQGLATAGFDAGATVLRRDGSAAPARVLVDVDGFVAETDPRLTRLAAILRPPIVLGAYAVPIQGAAA